MVQSATSLKNVNYDTSGGVEFDFFGAPSCIFSICLAEVYGGIYCYSVYN